MLFRNCTTEILMASDCPAFVRACFLRARQRIYRARQRIYIEQFFIDIRPEHDSHGEVRYLLNALCDAAERGLDVRVLLACVLVSRSFKVDVNELAAQFLLRRNVDVRKYVPDDSASQTHVESILCDGNLTVAGSHNWTPSAFRINEELSVATASEELALWTRQRFLKSWQAGGRYALVR